MKGGFPGMEARFNGESLGWFPTREAATEAIAAKEREMDEWRRHHVCVHLTLTRREADELLRRVHDEGRHTRVHPDLREAWHKLREALDHSTRG